MEKHYFNMQVNSISLNKLKELEGEKSKMLFKNSEEIPESDNIMVFKGIFSQNFKKGEKSRNGYKYDQNGWVVDNYARLPIILWQHDDNYGGIGMTQELYLDTNGNLAGIFYVDLDTLEERNAKQVRKGFVKSVSTGAITLEDGFEDNKTGKIYDEEKAIEKYGIDEVFNSLFGIAKSVLTYVVTKAELVENSLVTIGSNYGAIAKSVNTLSDEMKKKADELKKNNVLNLKNNSMSKKTNTNENEALETNVDTIPAVETEVEEVETEQEEVQTEAGAEDTKDNVLEVLQNDLLELKKDFAKLNNSLSEIQNENKSLKEENKVLKDKEKKVIRDNAPVITKNGGNVSMSINDVMEKYRK